MQIRNLIPWARQQQGNGQPAPRDEHPLADLQRQMNQAFDSFWSRWERPFAGDGWPFGEQAPRSDVVETEDGIEVTVELPGMEQKDVEVSLAGDALTIRGEKKVERKGEKKGYYVAERSYGSVLRTIPLPPGIDADKADATFRNGVLTVKIPHTPESRANVRRIEVKPA